jgi:hypothetical protein
VISPGVSEQQRAALDALNEASDLINAGFERSNYYIVKAVKERMVPVELSNHFVHYVDSKTIDESCFATKYDRMHSWRSPDARQTYATLAS